MTTHFNSSRLTWSWTVTANRSYSKSIITARFQCTTTSRERQPHLCWLTCSIWSVAISHRTYPTSPWGWCRKIWSKRATSREWTRVHIRWEVLHVWGVGEGESQAQEIQGHNQTRRIRRNSGGPSSWRFALLDASRRRAVPREGFQKTLSKECYVQVCSVPAPALLTGRRINFLAQIPHFSYIEYVESDDYSSSCRMDGNQVRRCTPKWRDRETQMACQVQVSYWNGRESCLAQQRFGREHYNTCIMHMKLKLHCITDHLCSASANKLSAVQLKDSEWQGYNDDKDLK